MSKEGSAITIEKLVQGGRGLAGQEGKVLLVRAAISKNIIDRILYTI